MTANGLYFLTNVAIGLWLVPYLIRHLGIAVYGVVPLATSISGYLGVITIPFNMAVSRFLSLDLQRSDYLMANKTFNTALLGSMMIAAILLPCLMLLSWSVPWFLNIPTGNEMASRWLFMFLMMTFLITVVSSIFSVSPFSKNRLECFMSVQGTSLVFRALLLIVLFSFFQPQLWHVGIGFLGGSVLGLVVAIIMAWKLTPELSINRGLFEFKRLKSLLGMSWWVFVNQVGSLLFLNVELIIVNKLFGTVAGGKYGSILQLVIFLRAFSEMLSGTLTPTFFALYSKKEISRLIHFAFLSVRFLGLFIAIPIGLMCGFSPQLLEIWLGGDFVDLWPLMVLLVSHLAISLPVRPLFAVHLALKKVKFPGTVSLIMGVVNVILALALASKAGWGFYGVAAAGAIALTMKNGVLINLYTSHILKKPWYAFMTATIPAISGAVFVAGGCWLTSQLITVNSWFRLCAGSILVVLLYSTLTYFVVLSKEDRTFLLNFLPGQKDRG